MKNYIFTFLAFALFWPDGISQTFTCPGNLAPQTAQLGPTACKNNGLIDYISVTLQVTDVNACSGYVTLSDLPADVSVGGQSISPATSYTFNDGSYDLAIPSDNCESVNYSLSINSSSCDDCTFLNQTLSALAIPTMGQWGLIILCLLCVTLGAVFIKKRAVREIWN